MGLMTTTEMFTGVKNWVLEKIALIQALIPAQASAQNQLADKNFVNSSIATATATFRGTYNLVSDLSLTTSATQQQIAAALATKMTALSITPDTNDYAFVQIPAADATPTVIARVDRYKFNGSAWAYEYSLNNSGFTAAQWAAINSGATLELIGKLSALPTNAELTTLLNAKANKSDLANDVEYVESEEEVFPTLIEKGHLLERGTENVFAPKTLTSLVKDTTRNRSLKESLTKLTEYQSLGFPAFSTSVNYAEGDVCFHDRKLYKAKAGGHTAGAWNSAHFDETSVKEYTDAVIYDVSANNPTAGPNNDGKFTLAYILTNANTLIPKVVRKGGMSIKFVQSSDNKYVQYRLTNQNWSIDIADWQEIGSAEFSTGEKVGEIGIDADEISNSDSKIPTSRVVYQLKDELLIGTQSETITDEAFVNNGNMYNTGNINSSNTNYRNTDLIPIKVGDVVTIDYTSNLYTGYEAICLYGLDVVGYLAKTYNTGQAIPKITATQDGYVRFCKKATDTDGSAIHIYHNGGELNEINEKLDELTYTGNANIQLKEADFKHVGSLLPDGTIYTSNIGCICTDLIEVGQNKNIVTNLYASYGLRTWVQYAEDGVTAVADSGNVLSASLRTFTMNSAAKYIRFCWQYKGNERKPFPVVKYEISVVSEIDNIKRKITTLETEHNIEYYSKDFELEDRGGGYVDNNTGAAEFSKTGYASPWIPLRKGTYKIKTESRCYVEVFRHVLYQEDYTTNERINNVTTTANVESTLVLSEAGFMRVSPVGSVTTGAEGIHIEQFGELEGDMPVLPTWDKLHISGFDDGNIRLYIPMGSGVFEIVNLRHYTSGGFAYMMEHWGIEMCYLSTNANDKTIVADYPITRTSEYEQAIDIVSDTHTGYIGGHMHGYEQMDSIQIKVDGVTRNDYHFCDDCEQVEIIQYSTLYETDKSTEIAKVTKRWVFDNKKFDTFINTIFSKGVTINRCMTAMFGILRRLDPVTEGGERGAYLTNKGMKDTSWQIVSTTDGWDNPSTYTEGAQMLMAGNNEATHLEQWGDLGYKTVLEVPKASRLTGAGMLIDTNGGTYNKMYYDCGSGQMNIGDYIFSHAIFKFGRFLT